MRLDHIHLVHYERTPPIRLDNILGHQLVRNSGIGLVCMLDHNLFHLAGLQ